jgi:hypothetical protein
VAKGQFRDVDELRSVMDALFTLLANDPGIGPALRDANVPQRFEFTDLGATLDVAPADRDAPAALRWEWGGAAPWQPAVTMRMRSDVANRFWQGKLNPLLAVATGKIQTSGDVRRAASLAPVLQPAHARYRELLGDRGLEHLLV